ncbi:MAG: Mor transcription activator family protein [Aeromonas veronii]
MKVMQTLGGVAMDVPSPKRDSAPHWRALLRDHLGDELAAKFMMNFGGSHFVIPKGAKAVNAKRDAEIVAQYEALCRDGLTIRPALAALSRQYQLSSTRIWEIVNS